MRTGTGGAWWEVTMRRTTWLAASTSRAAYWARATPSSPRLFIDSLTRASVSSRSTVLWGLPIWAWSSRSRMSARMRSTQSLG